MDYIIDFYKNLDTLNLIIFWGVIIVIILLLIFSIIMANKNRKLKLIIESSNIDKMKIRKDINKTQDIPIKVIGNSYFEEKHDNIEKSTQINNNLIKEAKLPTVEEKKFIAEEYIINYKNNIEENGNINNKTSHNFQVNNSVNNEKKELAISNKPYQKNVLREMSLNQTSPIGIIRNEKTKELVNKKAKELNSILNNKEELLNNQNETIKEKKIPIINQIKEEKIIEPTNEKSFNEIAQTRNDKKIEYLKEVSQKLNNAINDIERTEYEIKQEEEAIISYEELMKKKDTIKTIDEEEAVISIEELYQKEKNKLYEITEEEANDRFIDELKNFRGDL